MKRTDRLFTIILMLQRGRLMTAAELAAHFEVSQRTIYRDMATLSDAGVPIYGAPSEGYHLMPGYFLPPLMLNPEEAAAALLSARLMQSQAAPGLA